MAVGGLAAGNVIRPTALGARFGYWFMLLAEERPFAGDDLRREVANLSGCVAKIVDAIETGDTFGVGTICAVAGI